MFTNVHTRHWDGVCACDSGESDQSESDTANLDIVTSIGWTTSKSYQRHGNKKRTARRTVDGKVSVTAPSSDPLKIELTFLRFLFQGLQFPKKNHNFW